MEHTQPRAFTLIELLVVIAIIGLLAAVILSSLNLARSKGTDASIRADLHTVQSQAALDYTGYPNSYGPAQAFTSATSFTVGSGSAGASGVSIFGSGASGDQAAGNAMTQAVGYAGTIYYGTNGTSFFIAVPLKAQAGYWCADSSGTKLETATPTSAGDGTTYSCSQP